MHEPVSLTSLFDAAEQAALGGDYAAAARLLEDAAREQEATLGPDHRDLANTLNNLAVAHERSGDLDAAEREYRRAHAIAKRAFPSDDPLVITSAQNLRDFCLVNGRSIDGVTPPSQAHVFDWPPAEGGRHSTSVERYELPTTPADVVVVTHRVETPTPPAPTASPAAATAAAPAPARPVAPVASTPGPPQATPQKPPAPTAAPAAVSARPTPAPVTPPARVDAAAPTRIPRWAVGFAVVALASLLWLLFGRRAEAPRPAPPEPVMDPVSPPPTAGPAPAPVPAAPASAPAQARSTTPPAQAAADGGGVSIGEARLCTSLVNYRCAAATSPVRAGQLTFYTRLVATRDTAVVHRWYRGDELRQAVRLGVPARAQGFRTYSRGTVYATGGHWRVELRTLDGRILHTETFTVQQ